MASNIIRLAESSQTALCFSGTHDGNSYQLVFDLSKGLISVYDQRGLTEFPLDINLSTSWNTENKFQVAQLQPDRFALVWEEDADSTGTTDVHMMVLDERGDEVSRMMVNQYTTNNQFHPTIAVDPSRDGSYNVAWLSTGQNFVENNVICRSFSADGQPLGDEFALVSTDASWGSDDPPRIAVNSQGHICLYNYTAAGNDIRVIDQATGELLTYGEVSYEYDPQVIAFANGDFGLVSYDGASGDVKLYVLSSDESRPAVDHHSYYTRDTGLAYRIVAESTLNSHILSTQRFPEVVSLEGGRTAVAWTSKYQDGDLGGIFGVILDPTGTPIGEEFQINLDSAGDQTSQRLTATPDGGFLASWVSGDELMVSAFDSQGSRLDFEYGAFSPDLPLFSSQ